MKRRSLVSLTIASLATALVASDADALLISSFGPIDGVAAQRPTYTNCSQCHFGNAVNGGDGSMVISGVPAVYTPGTAYPIQVTLEDPGQLRWGFEMVVLDEAGSNLGSLASVDPNTQVSTDFTGRMFAKHTLAGTMAGTMNGPVSWNVAWTAPAAASGPASFYAAGNAANFNGSTSGDFIYTAASVAADTAGDALLVLQPDTLFPRRGTTWNVRARIRDTSNAANSVLLVSRVNLGGGNFFPPTGFLLPPVSVSLVPDGQLDATLTHPIAAMTPLITATYEGFIGRAPSTLVDADSFTFSVTP